MGGEGRGEERRGGDVRTYDLSGELSASLV